MSWGIWLALSILGVSIQTLITKALLKNEYSNPISYAVVLNFLTGVISSSLIVIFKPSFVELSQLILPILFSNFLYGAGLILIFKSLKLIEASEYIVLFSTRIFWVILTAVIIFGEKFSLVQLLGAILILISVYLAGWKSSKFKFGKGEIFALCAAPFFGIAFSIDKQILTTIPATLYVPISFLLTSFFATLISPKQALDIKPIFSNKQIQKLFLLAILFSFSSFAFLYSLQLSRQASLIASLNQSQVVVTVVLALIFLKERKYLLRKLLAALICFSGVLLVI